MTSSRNHVYGAGLAEKLPSRDPGLLTSFLVVGCHWWGTCPSHMCCALALLLYLYDGRIWEYQFSGASNLPLSGREQALRQEVSEIACSRMHLDFNGLVSIKAMCGGTIIVCCRLNIPEEDTDSQK